MNVPIYIVIVLRVTVRAIFTMVDIFGLKNSHHPFETEVGENVRCER